VHALRKAILDQVSNPGYRPTDEAGLARALGVSKNRRRTLTHTVRLLLSKGELRRVQGDRLARPDATAPTEDDGLIVGRIAFRAGGHALVTPQRAINARGPIPQSFFIPAEDTEVALHGDLVAIRPAAAARGRGRERERPGAEPRARVVRVVERARSSIVGHLKTIRHSFYVTPDDPRLVHDIAVPDPASGDGATGAKPGDKVVVQLLEWRERSRIPEGRVIERLGEMFAPRAELAGVYRKFSLAESFPDRVLAEAADLPASVPAEATSGREDFRTLPVLTIDPDDAKDFDDALSFEELADGAVRIGVHIADVSAYVRPGTALDAEAQRRGNSTYLVGTVVPMLPEKLSNGLCSLVEGQDRLCRAVILTFDRRGRVTATRFAATVIRSRKRLTYRQAYGLLFTDDLAKIRALPLPAKHATGSTGRALSSLDDAELSELQRIVRHLWRIAEGLRHARMDAGSLDLDMPEAKIFVDAEGFAERIERIEHDESHQLIEEFMLAANESVARATREQRRASLYRVHDEPDPEKLGELRELLGTLGVTAGDLTRRPEVVRLLTQLHQHPQGHALRTQLLRSLKRAAYRATPDGHYGLNKSDYTHFTSPIRRYSDLVVHRVVATLTASPGGATADTKHAYSRSELETLGEHLSLTEANSQEAERESQKIKLLEFFERELHKRVRARFPALITDVRPQGLFVELTESMAFGLISAASLSDDTYLPSPDGRALVGRRTRRRLGIGSVVEVRVASVDRFKRQIDFRLA
jgi:ribonuclease R